MSDKEQLKKEVEQAQLEAKKLSDELAAAEAAAMHRLCRYRYCGKEFATDDDRRHYCCTEHYLAENREKTKVRNEARKTIDTDS